MAPKQITLKLAIRALKEERIDKRIQLIGTAKSPSQTAKGKKQVAALTRAIDDLLDCLADARATAPKKAFITPH